MSFLSDTVNVQSKAARESKDHPAAARATVEAPEHPMPSGSPSSLPLENFSFPTKPAGHSRVQSRTASPVRVRLPGTKPPHIKTRSNSSEDLSRTPPRSAREITSPTLLAMTVPADSLRAGPGGVLEMVNAPHSKATSRTVSSVTPRHTQERRPSRKLPPRPYATGILRYVITLGCLYEDFSLDRVRDLSVSKLAIIGALVAFSLFNLLIVGMGLSSNTAAAQSRTVHARTLFERAANASQRHSSLFVALQQKLGASPSQETTMQNMGQLQELLKVKRRRDELFQKLCKVLECSSSNPRVRSIQDLILIVDKYNRARVLNSQRDKPFEPPKKPTPETCPFPTSHSDEQEHYSAEPASGIDSSTPFGALQKLYFDISHLQKPFKIIAFIVIAVMWLRI